MITLAIDPGEDTGWSIWNGTTLACGGTTKMPDFQLDVWEALTNELGPLSVGQQHLGGEVPEGKIERMIIEDWSLYPKELRSGALDWDKCRTARLIGALTFMARVQAVETVFQAALIKERAQAGGAKEFFFHPLRENRHTNDSIMHAWFYFQTQVLTGRASV